MNNYVKLMEASNEELLEATIKFYSEFYPDCEKWIRLGFELSQENGWEQVAPIWLDDYRTCKSLTTKS